MTLTDGLVSCALLVDYCDVFISSLNSHSDGTHLLHRIHSISPTVFRRRNELIYLGLKSEQIFTNVNFWVNYSFNAKLSAMMLESDLGDCQGVTIQLQDCLGWLLGGYLLAQVKSPP